jgi:hypothetical protein
MTIPASAELPNYPWPANARTYDAEFIRMMMQAILSHSGAEGIAGASTDLAATPGSNLVINVAAGRAFVKGDDRSTQGSYFCYVDTSKSVTAAAAHATNPRIDRLVLRVYDADVSGASTKWEVELVQGTPTAGATLSNLNGAAAVPNGALLLYNVLVPATFTGPFVGATHFQDRRFNVPVEGRQLFNGYTSASSDSAGSGDKLSTTVIGDGTTPVWVAGRGHGNTSTGGTGIHYTIRDGASGAGTVYGKAYYDSPGAGYTMSFGPEGRVAAFSGSKTFYLYLTAGAGTINANDGAAGTTRWLRTTWGA